MIQHIYMHTHIHLLSLSLYIYIYIYSLLYECPFLTYVIAQLAGAVEYTDCTSAEG